METINKFRLFGLIIGGVILFKYTNQIYCQGKLLPDIYLLLGLFMLLMVLDIIRLRPGKSLNIQGVFLQYSVQKVLSLFGFFIHSRFVSISENIQVQQERLLLKILKQNSETDVGKLFRIGKIKNIDDFCQTVPLTTYDVYELFVNKIEETGGSNVFFPGKVDYIAWTSGTTSGSSKKFPKSVSILRKTSGKWLILAQKCLTNLPRNQFIRKWLAVRSVPNTWFSNSGIKCGPISGLASNFSLNFYVIPDIAKNCKDVEGVMYLNLVFGLKYPDICNLFFSTAQMALSFFLKLEREWPSICDDIENGTLLCIKGLTVKEMNSLVYSLGGGDSNRAAFLRKEFKNGFVGIVPRIWPECPGLFCFASGSFTTQAEVVKKRYLGTVPIFSPFHAGTETFYGINLHLEEQEVTYTLMVPFNYFEFIPIESVEEDKPQTLQCNQLSVGEKYELVVTTWEGLYRYRTEDIIKIVGFYGTIPRYKFVQRRNDNLSVTTEHVPEPLVSEAIRKEALTWKIGLVDFVSTENINIEKVLGHITEDRYYTVFIELEKDIVLAENESKKVDLHLQSLHEMYRMFRSSGRLQSLKIVQVRGGTFQNIGRLIRSLNKNTSLMQYKLPRIVRSEKLLQYLLDNRLSIRDGCEKDSFNSLSEDHR